MSREPISESNPSQISRRQVLRLAAVAGLSLAGAALAACGGAAPAPLQTAASTSAASAQPVKGGTLTWVLRQEPDVLDPHVTSLASTATVDMRLYDNLVMLTPDMKFVPGVAEKWDISDDWKTYTFTFRKGVKFHDGTPFNAQEMKASIERMVDPATKSRLALSFVGPLGSTEIVDEYTIKLNYKEPYPPLLNRLARPPVVPASSTAFKKYGEDYGRHPVGTGPFKFVEWVAKDHITMERNPDYQWAWANFKNTGPSYFDKVIFKFSEDEATRSGLLESGEANVVEDIPEQDVARLKANPKLRIYSAIKNGTPYQLYFNTQKAPTNDVKVRQAINYAIDRDSLTKTLLFGVDPPHYNVLSRAMWAYDKSADMYQYDQAKAKQLLDEAGWKPGPDGIRVKDGQRLRLIQVQNGDIKPDEFIQGQLRAVGIEHEIQQMSVTAQIAALRKSEHNLTRSWWVQSDPDILRTWLTTENIPPKGTQANYLYYSNAELDKLLLDASQLPLNDKRKEMYSKVQRIVMENSLVAPLWEVTRLIGTTAALEGASFNADGYYLWVHDAYLKK